MFKSEGTFFIVTFLDLINRFLFDSVFLIIVECSFFKESMMQQKNIIRLSPQVMVSFMVLLFPLSSQGTIAYIPQTLRECISVVGELAEASSDVRNLQELCDMIKENRILASDDMTHKAVQEALEVMKASKNKFRSNKQRKVMKEYLKEYLNSLDDSSVLLAIKGEGVRSTSWPMSFVARSLPLYSVDMDMMNLSSELASTNNIQLCGNGTIAADIVKESQLRSKQASFLLGSYMMSSPISHGPNVIFGTGVASHIIATWSMSPSISMQSPINMKFTVPKNLKLDKPISLELHFLVSQQGSPAGKARIQVEAQYKHHRNVDSDMSDSFRSVKYKKYSDNFMITEPHSVDELKHISVKIPLKSSKLKKSDMVHLALMRVEPTSGTEYGQDIYLASAVFRYRR